ncbi:FtsQ-type POTRA domain-containing protein [Microvirga tunisiensis]|uniref:FtsQ-type POTRA domain-containing protein n=2 Tax=Pannonibacter tanglangensis TaxID=2750084 RepID=A0ABW9ZG05_9HYPH|nr:MULTISPECIES: cell division protein FtsQ/DivIB [unclassified Pannonibacter]NBN63376.1 FtsQ-type POTRA domain-containing protein [Pannonibacter sp. XCT-34]NBN77011.1 FtsQ-type POTRA domain-containing protein [Pannonibacter sp. XCT-53]
MLSLRRKAKEDTAFPLEAELAPRGRGVARLHQRPLWRQAGRLAELPRGTGSVAAVAFLAATITYGVILGGYGRMVSEALISAAGFGIETVKLSGQRETSDYQILSTLGIEDGASMVMFDVDGARERLTQIPWIKSASVMKLYPNTLKVTVEERIPFALWQRGTTVSIINEQGDVITDQVDGRYANLLLVVNEGAQKRAGEIIAALDKVPVLRPRVRAAFLVSNRRWDLMLENGITVRLPENGMDVALAELVEMDASTALLTRDIAAVDLRLADRVVVRLTDEAAERRRESLEGKDRVAKRGANT